MPKKSREFKSHREIEFIVVASRYSACALLLVILFAAFLQHIYDSVSHSFCISIRGNRTDLGLVPVTL